MGYISYTGRCGEIETKQFNNNILFGFFTAGPFKKYRAHYDFGDRRDLVTSARTYFYEDEAHCDENMQTFINSIDAVSGVFVLQ